MKDKIEMVNTDGFEVVGNEDRRTGDFIITRISDHNHHKTYLFLNSSIIDAIPNHENFTLEVYEPVVSEDGWVKAQQHRNQSYRLPVIANDCPFTEVDNYTLRNLLALWVQAAELSKEGRVNENASRGNFDLDLDI